MTSAGVTGVLAILTGLAGFIAAALGVLKYFNYRSRRDRMAAVGAAFEAVVESLSADDELRRMAGAIRLRRFFDPRAELATGGLGPRLRRLLERDDEIQAADAAALVSRSPDDRRALTSEELPYAADAINVIVAILRGQPPGNFQKLLADALTRAPKELLAGVDLQRANLQNAWLGRIDLPGADFYRADVSNASFKEARAQGAQFYEARLARTRFTRARVDKANFFGADLPRADFTEAQLGGASFADARARRAVFRGAQLQNAQFANADVRDADFRGADLSGASFAGARLAGARFADAVAVPEDVARRLGPNSVHPADAQRGRARGRIFLSQPAMLTADQQALVDRVGKVLETGGAEPVRLRREEYPASGSLAEIRRLMSRCTGVVIVGLAQLVVADGRLRPGTPEETPVSSVALPTPWNHVEAGMAFALDLPVLVVHEQVGDMGVFGMRDEASTLTLVDVHRAGIEKLDEAVESWLRTLSSF